LHELGSAVQSDGRAEAACSRCVSGSARCAVQRLCCAAHVTGATATVRSAARRRPGVAAFEQPDAATKTAAVAAAVTLRARAATAHALAK